MEDEVGDHAVGVDASEDAVLPLGYVDEPQDEQQEQCQHGHCAHEALLLTHGAEDEVGVLLRHILELRLSAVEESFAGQSAGADGYLALVDVVARAAQVVLDAERHFDAHLLMVAKDVVEDVVHREHEQHRGHHEADGDEVFGDAQVEHHYGYVDNRATQGHKEVGHAGHVHTNEREQPHQQPRACEAERHVAPNDEVAAVDEQHDDEQNHDGGEDDELPQGDAHYQRRSGIFDRDDEPRDGTQDGEQDDAGHPLAVEHEDERDVDQGGAGLALKQDEGYGEEDDGQRPEVVANLGVEAEIIGAEQARQGQGCCEFAELGGLEADRPQYEPRMRTLDIGGKEDGGYEQQNDGTVDGVGVGFVDTVVDEQNDQAEDEREPNPHGLLAGELREIKHRGAVEVIARGVDAHNPAGYEQQVEDEREPVQRAEHRGLLTNAS